MDKTHFKFIDLFAGIGGFHQALTLLGGKCVFASEIDNEAIKTYKTNYNIDVQYDITKARVEDIPHHDVLCAGFPCQPFSKAGEQLGFLDKTKGTLFFEIERILRYHKPQYIILENVRNLVSHNGGDTWNTIKNILVNIGYVIQDIPLIVSPHQLGVPQFRERVVILGVYNTSKSKKIDINIPHKDKNDLSIYMPNILESKDIEQKYFITSKEQEVLTCWDEFVKGINRKVIGFPIWATEFQSSYDYKNENLNYPLWKQDFIRKNRELYVENKLFIDNWLKKWHHLDDFTPTEKKLEWQCGEYCASIWDGIIQFRPSGIRVKRPTVFPALVAMVQIPIIGREKRRLTPREAANLQSFSDDFIINENDYEAYKQFGNAVNVKVISTLAEQLFSL